MVVNAESCSRASRWTIALLLALALTGCATNPVTGKAELAFISEAQEIAIGRAQYAPGQQMQGGS